MKWIALALKSLFRSRRRTLLTVGAVAIALFIFTTLQAVLAALSVESVGGAGEVRLAVIEQVGGPRTELPEGYGPRLARLPHVMAVTPLNYNIVRPGGSTGAYYVTFAVDPEPYRVVAASVAALVPAADYACFTRTKNGALVGADVTAAYGWRVGDRVGVRTLLSHADLELVICGELRSTGASTQQAQTQVVVNRAYYREAVGKQGKVNLYWLRVDDARAVPSVIRAATDAYADGPMAVSVQTEGSMLAHVGQFTAAVRMVVQGISLAVLATVLVVTVNTIALSMRERRKEIAVMKALGYAPRRVLGLVVLEAVTTAAVGGAVGTALAAGLVRAAQASLAFGVAYDVRVTPRLAALGVATSLALGVLSGLLPAVRAARLHVIRVLHSV